MGLFDGFNAGWNSFVENELNATKNVLLSPNPVVKAIFDPLAAMNNPASLLPSTTDKGLEENWNEMEEKAADVLLSPNPLISAVTGNYDDIIPGGKSAEEKWDNVVDTVEENIVDPVVNETEKTVENIVNETEKTVETVKETFKETVTNVTKGVGDALPIIAIGGAAILGLSLLLGRR